MKTSKLICVLSSTVILLLSTSVLAESVSNNFTVSATVKDSDHCAFNINNIINLGIKTNITIDKINSTNLTINCSYNLSYTINLDNGLNSNSQDVDTQRNMKSNKGELLPYTLQQSNINETVSSNNTITREHKIYAEHTGYNSGIYNDIVNVTIKFK